MIDIAIRMIKVFDWPNTIKAAFVGMFGGMVLMVVFLALATAIITMSTELKLEWERTKNPDVCMTQES